MTKKFIFISLLIIILISPWILLIIIKKSNIFKCTYVYNNLSNVTLDYIVLGSSRGLTTLNTNKIDSKLGLTGFNASTDGGGIATNWLMLNHLIHCNVKFKYCILVLDDMGIEDNTYQFSKNTYRFIPFFNYENIQNEINKFEDCREKFNFRASRFYPGFTVFENNKVILPTAIRALINPKERNRFDENGNYVYPSKVKIDKTYINDTVTYRKYGHVYHEFENLCKKNNIILITYIAPLQEHHLNLPPKSHLINHSSLFNNSIYFYDHLHVNSIGRDRATDSFLLNFKQILN
jgi:hypothetical protein